MSQQQINRISAKTYLNEAQEVLKIQADYYYAEEHFKIASNFNKSKFLHAQLYKDVLCTDDCEIINWLDKKLRGKIEGKIKLSKDKKVQLNIPDIIINNYYTVESEWASEEW